MSYLGSRPGQGGTGHGYLYAEIPTGAINGSNTVFTLAHTPANPSLMVVNLNGAVQSQLNTPPDYVYSAPGGIPTITFASAPTSGSALEVLYS